MFNKEYIPPFYGPNEDRPIIVGLVGRYGCGKSTYAQQHEDNGLYIRSHFKQPLIDALKPFNILTEGPNKNRPVMRELGYWVDSKLGRSTFSDVAHKKWVDSNCPYIMYDDVRRKPEADYVISEGGILLGFGSPILEHEEDAYEIPYFTDLVKWTHDINGAKING